MDIESRRQRNSAMIQRKGIAAGIALAASLLLAAAAETSVRHQQLTVSMELPIGMDTSLTGVEADMAARMEAQEVTAAIEKLDVVSLSGYYEIQEARELYENASDEARNYIDQAQLIEAEQEYAQLEELQEQLLAEAEAAGDLYGILDYAPCQVQGSQDTYLDTLVQELIRQATTEDMSRSQKLKACYTYMVENYAYGYNYNYSYGGGSQSVAWATAFLRDGYGACNNWSSAFVYVARALGYEADLYYGGTAASGGGSTEHYWPVIRIDGREYIFDPQVEKDMFRRTGVVSYKRFGLTGTIAESKYYFLRVIE